MLLTMTPDAWAQVKEIVEPLRWEGSRFDMTPNTVKITLNRPGPKLKKNSPADDWAYGWQRYWQAMHLIWPWMFREVEAQAGDPDEATENLLAEIERLKERVRELEGKR